MEIIKASEIHSLMQTTFEDQYMEIIDVIKKEAREDNYSLLWYEPINLLVLDWLKQGGFIVSKYDTCTYKTTKLHYKISWNDVI